MEAPKKFVLKNKPTYVYKTYIAAEMDALMREWYANLGQTISPEELKICREIDLAEVAAAVAAEAAAVASKKPVYGTPEFWKAYWAKKKAAAAGTGTPPKNEGARGTGCPPKAAKAKRTPATPKCAK
jgi:hypothetical protein